MFVADSHVCRLIRFLGAISLLLVLSACDSNHTTSADRESGTTDLTNSRFQSRPSVIRLAGALSDQDEGNLLVNPDFSNGLTGWSSCNEGSVTFGADSAIELNGQNCVHQSIEVEVGEELNVSCSVRRLGDAGGWAGVGLSFYDANWNFIAEPDTPGVNDTQFRNYAVTGVAPAGAQYAGLWVYTESGVAINGCSLTNSNDVTPPAEPPVEVELLSNPNFSDQLNNWSTCESSGEVAIASQDGVNTAVISGRNCIHQTVAVSESQALHFSCGVKRQSSGDEWAGVGLSFYDENWAFLSEPDAATVISESYRDYVVSGTVPTNARFAGVWVYATSGASISGCSLTASGDTELPQPEPPEPEPPEPEAPETDAGFCPAYLDSPLYRWRTDSLILSPEMSDWEQRIEQAPAGTEILLSDGEYLLDQDLVLLQNPDVTIRSLSGNRDAVVVRGEGFYSGMSEGFMVAADRITIAELTMHSMRRHAIAMKPELDSDGNLLDTYIYNMNIYDTGTQHVKGSDGGDNRNAVVACSTIGYSPGVAVGDYNGAIGIFRGVDVVVRDNTIYNLNGDGTGCNVAAPGEACIYESAPAIYMRESRDTIVERNRIIESFRGISLGLHNGNIGGVIRNNFIYRSGPGDMGISVELSRDTIVEHNTVLVAGYWAPIEVKAGTGGHVFRNNLTNAPIQLRGTSGSVLEGNIEWATADYFVESGAPYLQPGSPAIGAGVVPSYVVDDIDGDTRSDRWDVGADQFVSE